MPGRRSKSQYWSEHILGWRKSGLTQGKYCSEQGISYTAFGYWRTRLNQDQKKKSSGTFVPLNVGNAAQTNPVDKATPTVIKPKQAALIIELADSVKVRVSDKGAISLAIELIKGLKV